MLWHKGWLETRWKLLPALGWAGLCLLPMVPEYDPYRATLFTGMLAILLSGAGMVTPGFRAPHGWRGSTCFTLSLPVSRLRLLAVRAGLGWLEMIAVIIVWYGGLWVIHPKVVASAAASVEAGLVLVACASGLYAITVLLAAFLDDSTSTLTSMLVVPALWWFSNHTGFPGSANFFRAMGDGIRVAHPMPWLAMAFSVELAVILFFAAWKIAQTREY